jgi:hypothetical protein
LKTAGRALGAALIACAIGAAGCDKLGLGGKKDADGGTASSGGGVGGALSFLGGAFEGEITMAVSGKNTAKSGASTMTFGIKSPKVRVDMTGSAVPENPMLGQGAGFIIDPPAKKGYLLVPAQKRAMVIDFDKAKAQAARTRGGAAAQPGVPATPSDPPKVEKTGKKETIAGYGCEVWKVTSKTSHADMCVAEGIKWIDLTDLGMSSPEVALAAAASDLNHFPLRVVAFDDKNVETTRMEATKIEKKKLDEARFVVPPDYQLIDMSAMLGGLQGIGAGKPGLPPGFAAPKTR